MTDKRHPRPLVWGAVWLGLASVVAVLVGRYWGGEERPHAPMAAAGPSAETRDSGGAGQATDPVAASSPGVVSATELYRQYRDGRGQAGDHHRRQRLVLTGTLAAAEAGAEGVLVLTLAAGPDLESVRAVMTPADQARALAVPLGSPLVLDCLHQGSVMGEPVLADCRLPR